MNVVDYLKDSSRMSCTTPEAYKGSVACEGVNVTRSTCFGVSGLTWSSRSFHIKVGLSQHLLQVSRHPLMHLVRNFTRAAPIRFFHPSTTLRSNMSTSGVLYSSASLKADNAANALPCTLCFCWSIFLSWPGPEPWDILKAWILQTCLRAHLFFPNEKYWLWNRKDSVMEGKLDPMLLQALKDMAFDFMTPVQSQVLAGLPSMKSDWWESPLGFMPALTFRVHPM